MIDAVLLAGDRVASKPIEDENKAFLEFRGSPLFVHVLRALLTSPRIGKVVVVGPEARIKRALEEAPLSETPEHPIVVAEQGANLIENTLVGFFHSIGVPVKENIEEQFDEYAESEFREVPVLVLSCDLPLLTPWEVEEFIDASDLSAFDYVIGMSDESVMSPFEPADGAPGIVMSCYHLAESRCRHNNLHLGKPLKLTGMHHIERMYELRYQKRKLNMAKLFLRILAARVNAASALGLFFTMQLARSTGERRRGKFYQFLRSRNTLERVLAMISSILGLRANAAFTRYGGAVVDVDNAHDLRAAEERYDEWMDLQRAIHEG